MAIGRSISLQTPDIQRAQQAGPLPAQEQPQLYGEQQFDIKPPEGLQFIEGVTRTVYDKWSEINNYARTMKRNFGFDVTAPDITDPLQMQAYEAYQKGLADLYSTADVLKQSQQVYMQDVASGTQFYEGYDPTQGLHARRREGAIVRGIAPETEQVIKAYQKEFFDKGMTAEAQQEIDNLKNYWEGQLDESLNNGDVAGAQDARTNINALNKALYDPTWDKRMALERADIAARRKAGEDQPEYTRFLYDVNNVLRGDLSYLDTFVDKGGNQVLQNRVYDPNNAELRLDVITGYDKDKNPIYATRVFDLSNPNQIKSFLAGLANQYKGYQMNLDILSGLNPDIQPLGLREELAGQINQPVKIPEDIKQAAQNASQILTQKYDSPDADSIVGSLNNQIQSQEAYVPVGIPVSKGTGFGFATLRPGDSYSQGNEKINEVIKRHGGIILSTAGGRDFYIPLKESRKKSYSGKPERGSWNEILQKVVRGIGYNPANVSEVQTGTNFDQVFTTNDGTKYTRAQLEGLGYNEEAISKALQMGNLKTE